MEKTQVKIYLKQDDKKALDKIAETKGVSVTHLANLVIAEYLTEQRKNILMELYERGLVKYDR